MPDRVVWYSVLCIGAVVLVAGCAGMGTQGTSGDTPGLTTDHRGSSSTSSSALSDTNCTTPDVQAPSPTRTAADAPRDMSPQYPNVEVRSAYDRGTIGVIVTETATNTTIFARQYRTDTEVELNTTNPFGTNRSYRVTLRVDCQVSWQTTVQSFEGFQIVIGENGTVEDILKSEA